MAFPDSDMPITVEAAFGADLTAAPGTWSYTDISDRLLDRPITKRFGRSPGAKTTDAGAVAFTLDNNDAALTPLNPLSDYWPDVVLGLPIRITVNPTGTPTVWWSGYADSWQPDFTPTTEGEPSAVIRVTASGILRRLTQGAKPLRPALHRAIVGDGPAQFWALTDGTDATQAASSIAGGVPLLPFLAPSFGEVDGPAGAPGPLCDLVAGGFNASFPTVTGAGYTLELIAKLSTAASATQLMYRARFADSVNTLSDDPTIIPNDGQWHHYLIAESQVGADVYRERWLDGVLNFDFTFTTTTLLHPNGLAINTEPTALGPLQIGYVAIHPHANVDAADRYQAMRAWVGEMAHDRFARLCAEAGIPYTVTGSWSQPMGPQSEDTLPANLAACETADVAVLGEDDDFGLHFICHQARLNRDVDLTIDLATYRTTEGTSDQVLRPTFDDQVYRNEWVVDRPDGSEVVAAVSGLLPYEDSVSANLAGDEQLAHAASFRLARDSIVALRHPGTPVDLAANPTMIDAWLGVRAGLGRIVRTGLPSAHFAGDVDEMVDGGSETLTRRSWAVAYNGSPSAPYLVGVYGTDPGGAVSRYDSRCSELATPQDDNDVIWIVGQSQIGAPRWITGSTGPVFPLSVTAGGLVYPCSAISTYISDTFTRTASTWGTSSSGQAWTDTGGTVGTDYATTGSRGRHTLTTVSTSRNSLIGLDMPDVDMAVSSLVAVLATGGFISVGLVARRVDASNFYALRVELATTQVITLSLFRVAAGVTTTLATATIGRTFHSTGSSIRFRLQVVGNRMRARLWMASGTEPTGWDINVTDPSPMTTAGQIGCRSSLQSTNTNVNPQVEYDNFELISPQRFDVTRLTADKAHPAGTPINVFQPGRYALGEG